VNAQAHIWVKKTSSNFFTNCATRHIITLRTVLEQPKPLLLAADGRIMKF